MTRHIAALLVLTCLCGLAGAAGPSVVTMRVPDGGIQPQIAIFGGVAHLVYLKGPERGCDVFYTRSTDAGQSWAPAIRVNSEPGSAIAVGTIRGARIAIGRDAHVHVLWNGPGNEASLWYASSVDGKTFRGQRNMLGNTTHLDGGSAIAADETGHVDIVFHAAPVGAPAGEASRRVFLARSTDDGRTFSVESPIDQPAVGVCACCSLMANINDAGHLLVLYRGAAGGIHRDIRMLDVLGNKVSASEIDRWSIGTCPMSSGVMTRTGQFAWENNGQVFMSPSVSPTGAGDRRKYPTLATNANGQTLMAWTEGSGWNKPGRVTWQLFDASNHPVGDPAKTIAGTTWSYPAAFSRADGSFVILY